MYKIIIVLNCSQQNLLLTYKTLEGQQKAQEIIDEGCGVYGKLHISVDDDYGRHVDVLSDALVSVLYFNVGADLDAQADEQLLKQRANAKLQQRVASDPIMKLAMPGGAH